MFKLDPILEKDTIMAAWAGRCQLRLMPDQRYFWMLVVPEVEAAMDWHDLDEYTHARVARLVHHCSAGVKRATGAKKMNVASIGNIVPMLHIHIVARNPGDAAWPDPVWGHGAAQTMTKAEMDWRLAVVHDLAGSFRDELI